MAIFYNLEIQGVNGATNPPGDTAALNFKENAQTGDIIGKIFGFDPQEDLSKVIFTPNTDPGAAGDDYGRYGIKWDAGFNAWVLYIVDGGPVNFNFEDKNGPNNLWKNLVDFNVTFQAGYTPKADYGVSFALNIQNVNEAVSDLVFGTDATLVAGSTPAGTNVVKATWVDPDTTTAFRGNKYAFLSSDGQTLLTTDGGFSIDSTTGQITTNGNFNSEVAGARTLKVVAYDVGAEGTADKLRYVEDHVVTITAAALPALSIGDVTVTEGNGGATTPTLMTFTVTRTGDTTGSSTVDWALAHGTTTAGDFVVDAAHPLNGTLTFSAGQTTQTIVLQVNGDLAFEPNETFTITLSNATGATISDNSGAGTITNDDAAPLPALSIGDVTVTEGNGGATTPTLMTFTVTRTGDTTGSSTVDWALAHGTTTAGDFVVDAAHPLNGTLTFSAGQTTQTIVLQVNGDLAFEPNETFTITLSNATGATISDNSGAGTITNDDAAPLPALSIGDVTVTEGNGGATTPTLMTFTVTRTGDTTGSSTVDWALAHGTTTAGDFVVDAAHPLNGTLTFSAGQTTQTIVLQVNGDLAFEPNETFTITLSNATGATISDNSGAGTITNDDAAPLPALSIGDVTVTEGNGGATTPTLMTFTVTRTGDTTGSSTVDWALAHGTTTAGDFVVDAAHPLNGTLTFSAGQTTQTIVLQVNGDLAFEPNETFTITLSNATGATISDNSGAGTITNDDAAPLPVLSIAATDAVKAEGDTGYTEFTFTITRSGDTSGESTVNWQAQGSGANPASGADFIVGWTSGTVSFGVGETSKTIVVRVAGDTTIEPDETFSVVLSGPTNGTISATAGSAGGTILDDDQHAPTFMVDAAQNYFAGSTGAAIAGVFAGVDLDDLDGDQLTLTVSFLNANGALSGMASGGNVAVTDNGTNPQTGIHQYTLVGSAADLETFLAQRSFTPALAGVNTKFSFTLTDGHHAAAAYGDQITVLGEFPGNHAPVPPSASVVVHEGKPANFEVVAFAAVDDEGTTVDYQFFGAQANSGGKISGDGRFQIVGNKIVALDLSVGSDTQATYVVKASDGTYTVEGNVTITIRNNQAPTIGAVAASGSGRDGGAGTILVNDTAGAVQIATVTASDPDGAQDGRALTYTLADTYNGLFAIDPDGKVRIADASKLPVDADTPYQLTIQVSDGSDTTTQNVTVKVVNVPDQNHAPADLKLNVTHAPNEYEVSGTVVGALSASDGDGDALSYALLDNAGGRFKLVGSQLVVDNGFLFDYEQASSHKVTVQVSDGHGGVATEVFTIGVTDINPEITGGTAGADVFHGGVMNDRLYGGAGNDRLFGGGGRDIVKGQAGNDTLGGGAGKDKLYGGKGKFSKDMFVFDTKLTSTRVANKNVDKIYDFGPKYDSLGFDDLAFTNRTIAKYVKNKGGATLDHKLKIDRHWFRVGDKALDRNDFFIYNDKTHKLYFDVDGSGNKAMVEVASFAAFERKTGLTLTWKDFFLI